MLYQVVLFMFALQLKHLWVDFYLQTMEQVKGKGIYGNLVGFTHSFEHAVVMFGIVFWFNLWSNISPMLLFIIPIIDLVTHYHIDWMKMNWGNRDMTNPKFWEHLGLDQFAHQVVYLLLTVIMFI